MYKIAVLLYVCVRLESLIECRKIPYIGKCTSFIDEFYRQINMPVMSRTCDMKVPTNTFVSNYLRTYPL